jgi:uncharacterized protein (DUF58 family)
MQGQRRAFPLVSRRRTTGFEYGFQRSRRRGQGAEVAGSRLYRPGDRLAWIDWPASARISRARDDDVFIVREYYAELAPRVVVVVDRHPSMGLYPAGFPYLSKPDALREAMTAIIASAYAARAYVGSLDVAGGDGTNAEGSPHWIAPHRQRAGQVLQRLEAPFDGPTRGLELALDYLLGLRSDAPPGSFVFLLSDFLRPVPPHVWSRVRARQWELVPVIIQDPTWERTFPAVEGLLVPFSDPATGRTTSVRFGAREARARRESNEARFRDLIRDFQRLQCEPVVLEAGDSASVDLAFATWATRRRLVRGRAA